MCSGRGCSASSRTRSPLLHQRASQWYERHDLTEEAVRHALAARDFDRAAHLIELAVAAIRRHRQEAMMYVWLKALPDDAIRRSPVLSVFYGSMLLASGDPDAVEPRLEDAERALAAVPDGEALPWADTEDLHTLPSTIAIYRASLAQSRGDAAGTAEHARRAFDLAGPDDHFARGGAAGFLGLAAWAQGDVSSALETFTQAVASLHAGGSLVDELSGTVVLADLWLAAGRPSDGTPALRAVPCRRPRHGASPVARAIAEMHVGLSEIDVEAGDLASAREHLQAAVVPRERAGMNEGRYRWFVARGLLAQAEGDPDAAVSHLDQAEQLYRPGFFPDVRPIPAMKARIWIAQGKLSEAADWARDRGVSVTDDASYLSEFDHLTLVRLILAQHGNQDSGVLVQAASLLDRLLAAAETSGRAGSSVEIRLLTGPRTGRAGASSGGPGVPCSSLGAGTRTRGLRPALPGRGRTHAEPAARTLPSTVSRATRTIRGSQATGPGVCSASPQLPQPGLPTRGNAGQHRPAEPLSDRELQVLRLLDSELTGPQIARELFVSHNTVRTHTKHIFTKLDVTNRRAAVLRARERGLL